MADFLLELFSEEIPARMQQGAMEHLCRALEESLTAALGVSFAGQSFVTPRRLAVIVHGLPLTQPDTTAERKGPKIDAPAAALEGFLRSTGLTREQLETRQVGKDQVFFAVIQQKGRPTAEILKESVEKILGAFPWPKSMRWGSHDAVWVRPLHSILCIFDGKVVPVTFGPITASNTTCGHRFLAPKPIKIASAAKYEALLEKAFVIADRAKRQQKILSVAGAAAGKQDLAVKMDMGLLEEVTGLVEWPVALIGRIDDNFMDLPPEVLVSEMRGHQKYFALTDKQGTLSSHFLILANQVTRDNGKAVIAGNERVLRARLSDGRFFWDQDRKRTLDEWAKGLATVTFHAKLGTIADKVMRVQTLAQQLAAFVPGAEVAKVTRAAQLCKADLVTGMVGEFPELQGVMGRYYALHQGEDAAIADAIRDHYLPLGPDSPCPGAPVGICVALADKLDTLISMFAIGEKPTGSKDPFALRRAALGIIRIILENNLRLPLRQLQFTPELLAFFSDRLKISLKDQGIRHDIIDAVFSTGDDDLVRVVARAQALQHFLALEDGANLLAAYKRAANIVAIEEKKDKTRYDGKPDAALLQKGEEQQLAAALETLGPAASAALARDDAGAAMGELARLRAPVDSFFDKVLVNDKDETLRANRLRLLTQIRAVMDAIADFSKVEGN